MCDVNSSHPIKSNQRKIMTEILNGLLYSHFFFEEDGRKKRTHLFMSYGAALCTRQTRCGISEMNRNIESAAVIRWKIRKSCKIKSLKIFAWIHRLNNGADIECCVVYKRRQNRRIHNNFFFPLCVCNRAKKSKRMNGSMWYRYSMANSSAKRGELVKECQNEINA